VLAEGVELVDIQSTLAGLELGAKFFAKDLITQRLRFANRRWGIG
jgi:hypothetical protein